MSLTKSEQRIVEAMRQKRIKKKVLRTEPEFRSEITKVTVDQAMPKPDQSEDVAELRELK